MVDDRRRRTSEGEQTPSPTIVAARLAALRAAYRPERDDDARARLTRERPVCTRPFAELVSQRLGELRALCELARHLHAGTSSPAPLPVGARDASASHALTTPLGDRSRS